MDFGWHEVKMSFTPYSQCTVVVFPDLTVCYSTETLKWTSFTELASEKYHYYYYYYYVQNIYIRKIEIQQRHDIIHTIGIVELGNNEYPMKFNKYS